MDREWLRWRDRSYNLAICVTPGPFTAIPRKVKFSIFEATCVGVHSGPGLAGSGPGLALAWPGQRGPPYQLLPSSPGVNRQTDRQRGTSGYTVRSTKQYPVTSSRLPPTRSVSCRGGPPPEIFGGCLESRGGTKCKCDPRAGGTNGKCDPAAGGTRNICDLCGGSRCAHRDPPKPKL